MICFLSWFWFWFVRFGKCTIPISLNVVFYRFGEGNVAFVIIHNYKPFGRITKLPFWYGPQRCVSVIWRSCANSFAACYFIIKTVQFCLLQKLNAVILQRENRVRLAGPIFALYFPELLLDLL